MARVPRKLNEWRRAVMSKSGGPRCKFTRYVLLALSLHMDLSGGSCFPSTKLLAQECDMSRKTVERYLRKAVQLGWVERSNRGEGQSWRRYQYQARWPKEVGVLGTPSGREDVEYVGGEGGSAEGHGVGHAVPMRKSGGRSGGSTSKHLQSPSRSGDGRDLVFEVWGRLRPMILDA